MINKLLLRMYASSTAVITIIIMVACWLLKWPSTLTLMVFFACLVFSFPFVLALHFLFLLASRIRLSAIFFWMVLLAAIPVLVFIPAEFFEPLLPGRLSFLILLGMVSAYVAVVANGKILAHFFNSDEYEKE